ncbi:hypothetical protein V8E53_014474 [Lactarius tabidus]
MAGYSRVKPPQSPHDNNDELSSLYYRPSIQNSPDWPSVNSPGHQLVSTNDTAMNSGGHEDHESIPQVIEVTKSLLRETQPGVASAEQKVEIWQYHANLVFKPGEAVDMELLAENRSLVHAGKLLRQPDTCFG